MKFMFLIGGFTGFALVALTGFLAGRDPGPLLRDAAAGCLAGALLFRWFWSILQKSLAEALALKRAQPPPAPVPAQPLASAKSK